MNEQFDLVGDLPPPGARYRTAPFRESTSVAKAELALRLNALLRKAPPAGAINMIDKVRAYKTARADAKKVAVNTRSSVANLTTALSRIEAWYKVPRNGA